MCGVNAAQYCGGNTWLSLYKACAAGSACVNAKSTSGEWVIGNGTDEDQNENK
jgi:hypothetical protein